MSELLHAITARMAQYFSLVVGPGHNAEHDTHWHVELTDNRSPHIHAIQADAGDGGPEAGG